MVIVTRLNSARKALITGAGSGIGRSFALALSDRGYQVHLLDVDGPAVAKLADGLELAHPMQGDVAAQSTMDRAAASIGSVDLLCLNAGVVSSAMGAPWDASQAEWDRVLGVNVFGVVNGLRSFVPLMLERGSPCQVIITASLAGAATWPGGGPYAASKHAVLAVAEQAALELADTNIGVTVLCPALVQTGMSDTGADPAAVVDEALDAADNQHFAVLPAQWAGAVQQRAADLTTGAQPTVPEPAAD